MQQQILLDYEEDITKYAKGLDKAKILGVYRKIPTFLGKDNKKFQPIQYTATGLLPEARIDVPLLDLSGHTGANFLILNRIFMLHAGVTTPGSAVIPLLKPNLKPGKLNQEKNSSHTETVNSLPMSSEIGLWMMSG